MRLNNLPVKFEKEYFLVLLPFYFVFHGFVENYVSVSTSEVLLLILQYLLATIILFVIFFLLFRSWRKAALYVFALMAFHFFFGAIHDTVKKVFPNAFFVKYTFILPFCFLVFIILAIILHRSSRKFARLVQFLNLLLIVFILIDIPYFFNDVSSARKKIFLNGEFSKCDSCYKPDIYLIIADEYAGKQELSEVFHFDNTPFEQALQSKGFHIINNSKSNYNYTPFSTASIFSMDFLTNIEGANSSKHDMNICYGIINKNNLWNFFDANGYEIKNCSIFNVDDIPTKAPQSLLVIGSKLITSQTFLSRIDRDIRFNLVTRFKIKSETKRLTNYVKECNERLYDNLIKESKQSSKKPRFVYTHLMMPHYPYYFDSKGNPYPLEVLTEGNQIREKEYIEYLQYCNGKFIQLLDAILANSKKLPVIIFMGDHGWRHFIEKVDHQYYFMNLASIYLPDKNYTPFYDGMSNVNIFRTLLNSQFHQKLPLLKDSTSFLKE
jgi:hypothetical protein